MSDPGPATSGPRRVLLHVGTPKTGTSHLQDVLFRNRSELEAAGIRYPADRFDEHFLAALDLMGMRWGGLEKEAVGAWDRVATRVREHPGTAIVSHEILAAATRPQVERALASLGVGGADEPEVHLLLSVRDLVRQVPAEWQENVKHRRTLGYARFLELIGDPERASRVARWFWDVQDVPAILDRWGRDLPPGRVHVITVPPAGSPTDLLWHRFSTAFGLDGLALDLHAERANPSLGADETALLRRINRSVHGRLPSAHYRPLVRELLVHQTLAQRRDTVRLGLPPELAGWADDVQRSWVSAITARGYDVVGNVDDLLGSPATEWVDPDHPRERAVAQASVEVIEVLLLDTARLRDDHDRLHRELAETHAELARAQERWGHRFRSRVVRRLETGRPGRVVLGVYRRARRRPAPAA